MTINPGPRYRSDAHPTALRMDEIGSRVRVGHSVEAGNTARAGDIHITACGPYEFAWKDLHLRASTVFSLSTR